MKLFRTKQKPALRQKSPEIACASRYIPAGNAVPAMIDPLEAELYDRLRYAVPVLDAAIMKIIRLTGNVIKLRKSKIVTGIRRDPVTIFMNKI